MDKGSRRVLATSFGVWAASTASGGAFCAGAFCGWVQDSEAVRIKADARKTEPITAAFFLMGMAPLGSNLESTHFHTAALDVNGGAGG
jgi:hypothetical protein